MESYSGGKALRDYVPQNMPYALEEPANTDDQDIDNVRNLLLKNLSQMPVNVDELARTCHVSIPALQMAMLEMELAGRLQRLPGNKIVLIDE